jgi:hypothetical protein
MYRSSYGGYGGYEVPGIGCFGRPSRYRHRSRVPYGFDLLQDAHLGDQYLCYQCRLWQDDAAMSCVDPHCSNFVEDRTYDGFSRGSYGG